MMDQVALYEQQALDVEGALAEPPYSKLRDMFVVDRVRRMQQAEGRRLQVVELSIGDGLLSQRLLGAGDVELLCADISSRRLERLKERLSLEPGLAKRAAFVECNFDTRFDSLSLKESDVVVALDIIEHVFDVFGFLGNCHKILRQGGLLMLRAPNIAFIRHRFALLRGQLPITASWFGKPGDLREWRQTHGWDGGHLHLFTIPILRKLLSEEGFTIEDCRDAGARFERIRDLCPSLLYANPLLVCRKG